MENTTRGVSFREIVAKYKLRVLLIISGLTVFEILFLILSAFISWEDILLRKSGIDLSFGGLLITVTFIISFILVSLIISSILHNLDKKNLSINDYLPFPTKKVMLQYTLYFVLSLIARLIAIVLFFVLFTFLLSSFSEFFSSMNEIFVFIILLIILSFILGIVDIIGANIKSLVILKYKSTFSYTISTDNTKGFLIEFFKNLAIISLYIVLVLLKWNYNIASNEPLGIAMIFAIFFIFNLVIFSAFKMRKDRLTSFETMYIRYSNSQNGDEQKKNNIRETADGRSIRKILFPAIVSILIIFNLVIGITGVTYPNDEKKPEVIAVKSQSRYKGIINNSNSYSLNDFNLPLIFSSGFMGNIDSFTPFFLGGTVNNTKGRSDSVSESFSRTNTQVENIDEADIVKTDGKYIYYLKEKELIIVKAAPADHMKISYSKSFSDGHLTPVEIMQYKNYIAVILEDSNIESDPRNYYYDNIGNTIVKTYNIEHPEKPVLERSLKLKGLYKSSRLIKNMMYIVTTSAVKSNDNKIIYPEYTDTTVTQTKKDFDYNDVYYLPSAADGICAVNYISVYPIDNNSSPSIVKAYAGNAENIYVSEKYIYMIESSQMIPDYSLDNFWDKIDESYYYEPYKYGTNIYRVKIQEYGLGNCDTAYVSGRLHNQFSIDEYNGNLRLAVEDGNFSNSSSGVYVLNDKLIQIGSLKGLAPNEQIFSTRFMGNRLYMVTFKNVDPLFVIDLKDSEYPKVLGKLKIPGFSEYLHPYDENHIIGFGKNTSGGNDDFGLYQGIKMALFDVTDVNNPKEKFVENIGDRGSDSELLRNHKTLLYMNNPGIIAFPVSVAEKIANTSDAWDDSSFGSITFQGAYVYNINSIEGFKLRGKITHLSQSDIQAISNNDITEDPSFVDRIVYINNVLYTLSDKCIKATDYSSMKELDIQYFDQNR